MALSTPMGHLTYSLQLFCERIKKEASGLAGVEIKVHDEGM